MLSLFSTNQRVDFKDSKFQKTMHISDVMKTMDARLKVDRDTFKQYASDARTRETAVRFREKRKKLAAAGRI